MLKILIFIKSLENTGDISHTDAIYNAFCSKNMIEKPERVDFDAKSENIVQELTEYLSSINTQDIQQVICFAIGESGLNALNKLPDLRANSSKLMIVASIHQYFDVIKNLQKKLDFLAIPECVLDQDNLEIVQGITNYKLTLGVPTKNPSLDELKSAYDAWAISDKPNTSELLIIVMLPGDAPTKDGSVKLFTKESALELFNHTYKLWLEKGSKHKILLQNSPRTGKFDDQGKVVCNHEYLKDTDPTKAIDDVSIYFLDLLNQHQVPFGFYNFAFEISQDNRRTSCSVYNQLLFLAQANCDNLYVIPGESVSMLSQIPLYLNPNQIVMFKPSSMNEQNAAVLISILNRGHALCFDEEGQLIQYKDLVKMRVDDASNIIDAIFKILNLPIVSDNSNHTRDVEKRKLQYGHRPS